MNENMEMPSLYAISYFFVFFIGGLNNLIGSSCTADLAKNADLSNNVKAGPTIMVIVSASGTMGSAISQLVIGETEEAWGFIYGYWLVISVDITLSIIPLCIICFKEFKQIVKIKESMAIIERTLTMYTTTSKIN